MDWGAGGREGGPGSRWLGGGVRGRWGARGGSWEAGGAWTSEEALVSVEAGCEGSLHRCGNIEVKKLPVRDTLVVA